MKSFLSFNCIISVLTTNIYEIKIHKLLKDSKIVITINFIFRLISDQNKVSIICVFINIIPL
jgi:hypothetical protein